LEGALEEGGERINRLVAHIEADADQYNELCIQMEELRGSERQIQDAMFRLEKRSRRLTPISKVLVGPQQDSSRGSRTMAESHLRPQEDRMRNCSRSKQYRRGTRAMMAESHPRPNRTQVVEEIVDAQRANTDEEESVDERFDAPKVMDHDEGQNNIEEEDQTPVVVSEAEAESEELIGKTLTTAETISPVQALIQV
jgi:hypothetical protein